MLRIGILGAARIAPRAIIEPARIVPGVEIAAVAARDPARARDFAGKYGVPQVHETYDALIEDAGINAIYNPLPNSLHAEWTVRALKAGKHVLCEKPLAANAEEATHMAAVARDSGLILVEAFHYRYHPLAARMKAIVDSAELGPIRHIESHFCVMNFARRDIRYRHDLAGGATMDLGCYSINLIRFLAGAEPAVTSATARLSSPQLDRFMQADFLFPDGRTGRVVCALLSNRFWVASARVFGDIGELSVLNPFMPHLFYHRLKVRSAAGTRTERVPAETTYTHQLRAFARAVRGEVTLPTDAEDAVANMRVIDAIYERAGLIPRGRIFSD